MENLENLIEKQIKHWWLLVILGILLVIMGFWVTATPVASYVALSIFFSAMIFVSGISGLIFTFSNRKILKGWGWHLTSNLVDFVFGTILLIYPQISMLVLPFIVGFWFMFSGFSVIGLSGEFKAMGWKSSGWGIAFGILTILFAVLMILKPLFGALFIVYMTGFAFITLGVFRIVIGLQLKKLKTGNFDA